MSAPFHHSSSELRLERGALVRARAGQAVSRVLWAGQRLEEGLDYAGLGQEDRALLRELATGTIRWGLRLGALASRLLDRPLPSREGQIWALLLVGLYQLAHTRIPPYAAVSATVGALPRDKRWARGLMNGVLRRFAREADDRLEEVDALGPAERTAHPSWLVARLQMAYPEGWEGILEANNSPPPLSLRVRGKVEVYLRELEEAGIEAKPLPSPAEGIRLPHFRPVHRLPGFSEGRVTVQDGAAQLAAPLLSPLSGQRILDACSAPGGKLAHLLDWAPDTEVVALDMASKRLDWLRETLHRLGCPAVRVIIGDAAQPQQWWDGRLFDRILVDAPCSGTGVIRRHPDIKYLRREEDLSPMMKRQDNILEGLWPLLRQEGRLLYGTCSILPEENAERVTTFLANHADARWEPLPLEWGYPVGPGRQLLPGEGDMDGFFYAALVKSSLP